MSDETYESIRMISSWTLICFAIVGIPVNLLPFWLVLRKKSMSNFHSLLLILSISDLVVVSGCFTIYGLTDVWLSFNIYTYPYLAPWLIPMVQIALLTSIYATVLLSFERYVRIIFTCNLRHFKYFNKDNFKYYVFALLILPTLFYLPKFFEYQTVTVTKDFHFTQPCLRPFNMSSCQVLEEDHNITKVVQVIVRTYNGTELQFTALRQNYYYRQIYHMGLNTLVSSVIPFMTLTYLNISICQAVRQRTASDRRDFHTVLTKSQVTKMCRTTSFNARERLTHKDSRQCKPQHHSEIDDDEEVASDKALKYSDGMTEVETRNSSHCVTTYIYSHEVKRTGWFGRNPNLPISFSKKLFYKNEKTLTRVSIFIVWLFLACHIWRIVPNTYEALQWGDVGGVWPLWLDYVTLISHLVIVANSSLNFLVYLVF